MTHIKDFNKMKTDFKLIQPLQDFTDTENIAGDQIPVYNVKVFGTISPVFDDNEILLPLAIKRIPHFSRADGAVQVNGHSMKLSLSASVGFTARYIKKIS